MRFSTIALGSIFLAGAAFVQGQGMNVLPPLPSPLVLPPGNDEVLPIATSTSYLGDAIRVVDCPNAADEPYGTCGNLDFGGLAIYNTHLTGFVHIHFETPVNNIAHFEVTHPDDLVGGDVFMYAPQFYQMGIGQNTILDYFDQDSEGDLNLITGEVTNLNYIIFASNSFYFYLENANPQLKPPPFSFPGIYGSAYATFAQRTDGLLDFTFYGSTFLPLGTNVNGDPVRLPLPMCGPFYNCANIVSLGLSLHPHLALSTIPDQNPQCGAACPTIPSNAMTEFVVNSAVSDVGIDFSGLNVSALGGSTIGWSQVQGRVQIQFGYQNGNYIPVAITALPPEGLIVPPPAFPVAGLSTGWIGNDAYLNFPNATYNITGTATTDDPFDVAVGELDVTTGKLVGGLLWRQFWTNSLLTAVLADNPQIPQQSFWLRGNAGFSNGVNGETLFQFTGKTLLNFGGASIPAPNSSSAVSTYSAPANSVIAPFNNIQAAMTVDQPVQLMTGGQSNVLSSHSDTFNYSYSIPCAPEGESASFAYTNNNATSGGTFVMQNMVAVNCTNSKLSNAASGNYDAVAFAGFGSWSKDTNLHIATVQVVNSPGAPPYISIQIDGGQISNVDLEPATLPSP
jgi:hypothetical protein